MLRKPEHIWQIEDGSDVFEVRGASRPRPAIIRNPFGAEGREAGSGHRGRAARGCGEAVLDLIDLQFSI